MTSHAFTVGYSDRDQNAATGYGHTETTSATPPLPTAARSSIKHLEKLEFWAWSTLSGGVGIAPELLALRSLNSQKVVNG